MPEASAVSGSAPDAAADLLDPLSVGTRVAELTGDRAWLNAMIEVELSLTEALVAVGLAPGELTEVCAQLRAGGGFDPAAIAAAVIGGVSLFGGRGAIYAALLGALVIGTVSNGLNLMGVEALEEMV